MRCSCVVTAILHFRRQTRTLLKRWTPTFLQQGSPSRQHNVLCILISLSVFFSILYSLLSSRAIACFWVIQSLSPSLSSLIFLALATVIATAKRKIKIQNVFILSQVGAITHSCTGLLNEFLDSLLDTTASALFQKEWCDWRDCLPYITAWQCSMTRIQV